MEFEVLKRAQAMLFYILNFGAMISFVLFCFLFFFTMHGG